jgi:hypothetical protein
VTLSTPAVEIENTELLLHPAPKLSTPEVFNANEPVKEPLPSVADASPTVPAVPAVNVVPDRDTPVILFGATLTVTGVGFMPVMARTTNTAARRLLTP